MLRAVARGVPGAVRGLSTAAVQTSITQIPRRSIVALEGRDTLKFLQGSVTNNVVTLEDAHKNGTPARDAFYTAFLTPQGRVIADSFLYLLPDTQEPSLLMEVDEKIASELLKFIRRFKLRSKVKITDVSSEWDVYQAWGPNAQGDLGDAALAFRDVRTPDMGWRVLARAGTEAPVSGTTVSFDEYTVHRMLNGVPEGADELVNGSSLPLESCIDYMHGVDFHKGCYIGQELTARTYFTGLVRKRVMPVALTNVGETAPEPFTIDTNWTAVPEHGTDVRLVAAEASNETENRQGRSRSAGKFIGGIHNIGLALLRMEQEEKTHQEENAPHLAVSVGDHAAQLHAWRPTWWPASTVQEPA